MHILINHIRIKHNALGPTSLDLFSLSAVGGGTAGCVLAARLSENNDVTVLLLEAGGSDWGNPNIDIPGFMAANLKSDIDWSYVAERQEGLLQDLREEVGAYALPNPVYAFLLYGCFNTILMNQKRMMG